MWSEVKCVALSGETPPVHRFWHTAVNPAQVCKRAERRLCEKHSIWVSWSIHKAMDQGHEG